MQENYPDISNCPKKIERLLKQNEIFEKYDFEKEECDRKLQTLMKIMKIQTLKSKSCKTESKNIREITNINKKSRYFNEYGSNRAVQNNLFSSKNRPHPFRKN